MGMPEALFPWLPQPVKNANPQIAEQIANMMLFLTPSSSFVSDDVPEYHSFVAWGQ
jgi:hypothetical protein